MSGSVEEMQMKLACKYPRTLSKEAITTQNTPSVIAGVNAILVSMLTDSDSLQIHLPEKVVTRFYGESLVLGNYLVSYADSYPACDPKTNCSFFQKGNCPEIDCPFISSTP